MKLFTDSKKREVSDMAAAIPAIIGTGVSLFGASQAQKEARSAAKKQRQVAEAALSEEQRRFEAQFAAGEPFRRAGART